MAVYPYYGTNYANPYGVNGYYPQGYQTQPMVQPQAQAMQNPQPVQPVQPPMYSSGIIWVSGLMEAQAYPIAPNNAVPLWEKSGKTIYLKQADATGKPTMTVYDLVERKEEAVDSQSGKGAETVSYAKEDDLGKLAGVVRTMNDMLTGMKADVESMKSDMYGMAGKRKTAKKTEVIEDDDA